MPIDIPRLGKPYRVNGRVAICVGIIPDHVILCYTHIALADARAQGEELSQQNFKVPLDDSSIEEVEQ